MEQTTAGRRAKFAAEGADDLARQAGGAGLRRRPSSRGWTTRAVWYESDSTVMAVVGAQEGRDTEQVLAAGLSLRCSRELQLVLPAGWVEPTRRRLRWLSGTIQLWRHDGVIPTPVDPLPQLDPPHTYPTDDGEVAQHFGRETSWIGDLMDWAGQHPELDPGHRGATRAWHVRGQRALVIYRHARGLRVVAGIDSEDPRINPDVRALEHIFDGPLSAADTRVLMTKVERVIEFRRNGAVGTPDEHWLQSVLRRAPHRLGLEQPVLREVAAWRPAADEGPHAWRRGFVDLIGLDGRGDIHLVETKLGTDPMLVLQGIDYLQWALVPRNRSRLELRLGAGKNVPLVLHFVVGADVPNVAALGKHASVQADALCPELRDHSRFSIVTGWQHDDVIVRRVSPG